jgi:hypothetical protein
MVDYVPYTTANMPHDFELYSHQEQQLDFLPTSQPFLPSASYPMDPTFGGAFDPNDLQFHYNGIAQGVKASFQQQYASPMASPHSTSHSFHEHPPVLSASSESGASVSSSALGSPSQFNDSWNPLSAGLGLTPAFEYPGMVEPVKVPGCVGESTSVPSSLESFSSACPATPTSDPLHQNVSRSPATPASARWSASRSIAFAGRRNSRLSNVVRPSDIVDTSLVSPVPPTCSFSPSPQTQTSLLAQSESSCRFSSDLPDLTRFCKSKSNH